MNLNLPIQLAIDYKSKSQVARVVTEAWVVKNIPCPGCHVSLKEYPANQKNKDVFCPHCSSDFQIKSSKKKFTSKILGAEYKTTLEGINSGRHPSLMLLYYDDNSNEVVDFTVIHSSFLIDKYIIPRKPLSATAKRAGWQGCLIDIGNIPAFSKIFYIENKVTLDKYQVSDQWAKLNKINKTSVENRGWLSEILLIIDAMEDVFCLNSVYEYESHLKTLYPENNFIKDKIRQQLQIARDAGLISFLGKGNYKKCKPGPSAGDVSP